MADDATRGVKQSNREAEGEASASLLAPLVRMPAFRCVHSALENPRCNNYGLFSSRGNIRQHLRRCNAGREERYTEADCSVPGDVDDYPAEWSSDKNKCLSGELAPTPDRPAPSDAEVKPHGGDQELDAIFEDSAKLLGVLSKLSDTNWPFVARWGLGVKSYRYVYRAVASCPCVVVVVQHLLGFCTTTSTTAMTL